jgi:hypothetical protein
MAEVTFTIRGISRKQLYISAGTLVVIAILVVGAIFYTRQNSTPAGLPSESYKNLSFKVFFPAVPPNGFKFDPESVSSTAAVLAYSFDYSGKPISVTIQPLDPQLDIASFRPTKEVSFQIGKGYLAEYEQRTTIAIVADKSFIIINSPQQIPSSNVEQFAHSLRPVQ